jgi:hypothetical protein
MTYPANLCPLSGWGEFAGFREDFGQSIGKPIEAVSRRALREGTTEHFDGVLSKEERVKNTIYADAGRNHWCFRLWGQMPWLRAGQSQVLLQPSAHVRPQVGDPVAGLAGFFTRTRRSASTTSGLARTLRCVAPRFRPPLARVAALSFGHAVRLYTEFPFVDR